MYLGIDVGGTHTDAVALDISGPGVEVVSACKVATRPRDLLGSVREALERVLQGVDRAKVKRLNLSTTLSTNAIVEGRTEEVGVLVIPGPGMDPTDYMLCRDYHVLDGAMDHRGNETARLDNTQCQAAIASCRANGVNTFAVVGKFSVRNPLHENTLRHMLCGTREGQACERADFVTLGHQLGGRLNFPRRVATAYFNCSVRRLYNDFADAVERGLEAMDMAHVRVNVLKADGGTMPLAFSRRMPVQSIFSGPAASVMGIIALCEIIHDSVILDIGGTTTDIAVFAAGSPLLERDGIAIGSHPTLVRALKVKSIGVGGDSALSVIGDTVRVGPRRLGPSMAAGGEHPTLTDALNCQGLSAVGDVDASRNGMAAFAEAHTISPDKLAAQAVDAAARTIHEQTRALVAEINDQPVYTIHELIEGKRIVPRKLYLMGGPAEAMRMPLFQRFQLSNEAPEHFAVANAVGAALTRTTTDVELFADTQKHIMFLPGLGHHENIPGTYTLEDAKRDAMNHLLAHLADLRLSADAQRAEITHASSFNMVDGMRTTGRNMRVKCQIKPGVERTLG
ncbi:Hydantoinase/oxoprolinase N-terminal region [Paucidesulfovibrio gracilis DSM 16080]|uniref:Hydantoinase/oxoprolinase N-terminal region n=1 Tax=Paucidesulfovibrio gracilis DSM 16080 TaxID=1121449 RepID=A0A1T4XVG2_9BACT|nr:hydantoinase/oxoprolinase family protein [Paucidesulfovibrio gracilis]SKA93552.1 Hydantoinase/oxoprolinase N-terminal region [Paucidesulfovibrio gracilis DSM 16080]